MCENVRSALSLTAPKRPNVTKDYSGEPVSLQLPRALEVSAVDQRLLGGVANLHHGFNFDGKAFWQRLDPDS